MHFTQCTLYSGPTNAEKSSAKEKKDTILQVSAEKDAQSRHKKVRVTNDKTVKKIKVLCAVYTSHACFRKCFFTITEMTAA